jgi:hypothetical protein
MKTEKITIQTKGGKIIERKATVTEWLARDGRHELTAQVGNAIFRPIDYDVDHHYLWAVQ